MILLGVVCEALVDVSARLRGYSLDRAAQVVQPIVTLALSDTINEWSCGSSLTSSR
jgi:hypothetical protein